MGKEIQLGKKTVGKIKGNFYIPSYQRGYRWSKDIRRDGGGPLSFNLSMYPEDSHYIVYAQIPLKR